MLTGGEEKGGRTQFAPAVFRERPDNGGCGGNAQHWPYVDRGNRRADVGIRPYGVPGIYGRRKRRRVCLLYTSRQYRLKGWLYFFVGRQIKNTKAATNNPNGNAQKGQNKKDWSKKHQELRRVLYLCECPGGNDKIKFKQDASHAIIQGYSGADFYGAGGTIFDENNENKR